MPLERIYTRDTKSYFGILLDNNNQKWLARLYFNTANKHIGIHENEKQESKYPLDRSEDIYKFKDKLIATTKMLQGSDGADVQE